MGCPRRSGLYSRHTVRSRPQPYLRSITSESLLKDMVIGRRQPECGGTYRLLERGDPPLGVERDPSYELVNGILRRLPAGDDDRTRLEGRWTAGRLVRPDRSRLPRSGLQKAEWKWQSLAPSSTPRKRYATKRQGDSAVQS